MNMYTWYVLHLFTAKYYVLGSEYFKIESTKGLIETSSLTVSSMSLFHCAMQCVYNQKCSASSYISSSKRCLLDHRGGTGYPDFTNNIHLLLKRQSHRVTIQTPDLYQYSFLDDYELELRDNILKFSVRACKNAIIGLFTELGDHNLNMYEIVIGGAGNTNAGIRRGKMQPNKVTHFDSILSCIEHKDLWITWEEGTIRVGKGEETTNTSSIIMEWTDPFPLVIKVVGILTGWGATGVWIF